DLVLCLVDAATRAALGARGDGGAAIARCLVPHCAAHGRALPSAAARGARKRHLGTMVVPSPLVAAEFRGERLCRRRGRSCWPVLYRRGPVGTTPGNRQARTLGAPARQFLPLLQARTGAANCRVRRLAPLT